jgi:glycosyltransferase involved in cell wall biosynthesis
MRELVERHGVGGVAVASDPREIAAAIERVLEPEANRRYRAAARAAAAELDWSRERGRLLAVYRAARAR